MVIVVEVIRARLTDIWKKPHDKYSDFCFAFMSHVDCTWPSGSTFSVATYITLSVSTCEMG